MNLRIGVRLIMIDRDTKARSSVEFGGRVIESGVVPQESLAEALTEVERVVNEQLPHLRMHISLEDVR